MKMNYKMKSFLPGPWALNTTICVLFMAINMTLIVRTEFTFLLFYDISILCLILSALALMAVFLLQMHRGLPKLAKRLPIPLPTYICLLALTVSVSIGYCYFFVFKLALFGCDKAVEATNGAQLALDSAQRLGIALFAVISFVYIGQRAHVGSLNTPLDIFTRNFLNCVFGILWLRFLLLKGYFTIEKFCRDDINATSVIKDFCPPYIKHGFECKSEDLRPEQLVWNRLHYGLLKSVVVTCASELLPVLLVGHWLACGKAEKVVRKMTTKLNISRPNRDIFGMLSAENALIHSSNSKLSTLMTSSASTSTDSSSICSATLMMSSPWVRRCLRTFRIQTVPSQPARVRLCRPACTPISHAWREVHAYRTDEYERMARVWDIKICKLTQLTGLPPLQVPFRPIQNKGTSFLPTKE